MSDEGSIDREEKAPNQPHQCPDEGLDAPMIEDAAIQTLSNTHPIIVIQIIS